MKKALVGLAIVAVGALSAALPAAASSTVTSQKYAGRSPDSGTCGNNWAVDQMIRQFKVTAQLDGSYVVRENFTHGQFITLAGQSPEACGTTPTNGTVAEGIVGSFSGYFSGKVTGGTFDNSPGDHCVRDSDGLCTTAGFISGYFGGSAVYNITTYKLTYKTSDPSATSNKWVNADSGDIGDIATS